MNKNDNPECLDGVTCAVDHCKYHSEGNRCTAKHIDVKDNNAVTQEETLCGTFRSMDTWSIM